MKSFLFFLSLLLISWATHAQSYYFSGSGSDESIGTSPSAPWRNLAKVKSIGTLGAGDSILLERGGTFFGTIVLQGSASPANEIYIGAYGSGPDPIITGATELTGWVPWAKNLWVATCGLCAGEPGDLFLDGIRQPLGRFPNAQYMAITKSLHSKTALTDTTLTHPDNLWDGAEVVVKSSRWTIDRIRVLRYEGKTFQLQQAASAYLEAGAGYFIQNHLATLDQNGEWFFDRKTNRIFLYHEAPIDAIRTKIEVSVSDIGLQIVNSEYLRVENIRITNQRLSGASILRSDYVSLRNLQIRNSGANGLAVTGCKSPSVSKTLIADSNNNGVQWSDNVDGQFKENIVLRTGMRPGRGATGNGAYIGMSITAANPYAGKNIIERNRIDSVGYSAIDFRTSKTEIRQNLIRNFCLIKDDGGGIYTWNNPYGNNTIEGNTIIGGDGHVYGTTDSSQVLSSGIYVDDKSSNILIADNTIARCALAGIFVHNASRLDITGNKLFNNGTRMTNTERGQLLVRTDDLVPGSSRMAIELKVIDNTFFAADESTYCLFLSTPSDDVLNGLGTFLNNVYRAPQPEQVAGWFHAGNDFCNPVQQLDLSQWEETTRHVQQSIFKQTGNYGDVPHAKNLVRNGTMSLGTDGWMIWPESASVVHEERNILDGPSLKVNFTARDAAPLLYHAGIPLDKEKTYRLSFSARGSAGSTIEFVPLSATTPWNALGSYSCFALDTVARRYTYFFRPTESHKNARVNFRGRDAFWIDNVWLSEVALREDSDRSVRLIVNDESHPEQIVFDQKYENTDGSVLSGRALLPGYSAIIVIKADALPFRQE